MKSLPYTTKWTPLPEVASVRKALGTLAVRTQDLNNISTTNVVVESFDIALYLDNTYPLSGITLFPPHTRGLIKAFNTHVDKLFTDFIVLICQGIPFDPETAGRSKKEMVSRIPRVGSWEELRFEGEGRREMFRRWKGALGELGKCWGSQFGIGDGWKRGRFWRGQRQLMRMPSWGWGVVGHVFGLYAKRGVGGFSGLAWEALREVT